jgi:hypothetical protein
MTTSGRGHLVLTAVALALLASSAAEARAQADLPVGEARGVRAVDRHGGIVLVFSHRSAGLRKRINSRYAWMMCTTLGKVFSESGGGNLDIPRRGRVVRTGIGAEGADFCRVFLRAHAVRRRGGRRHVPRRVLFSIPLTQEGAVYLDEEAKARRLLQVSLILSAVEENRRLLGHPTYAQLVEMYPKLAKYVVELAGPGDTPPPKRVGYYGDGRERLVLAIVSASGRRLFLEESAGGVLSTNVAGHLFGDPL